MRSLLVLAVLALWPGLEPAVAQAFLARSPNIDGTWIPDRHAMQFNFQHRFYVTPNHTVINAPTLTWTFRLPWTLALGVHYSTRSSTLGGKNEMELYGRWQFKESGARRIGLSATGAWNTAAKSFDGEVGIDWSPSRFTIAAVLRGMSNAYDGGKARAAFGTGGVVRLNNYVALAADVATLIGTDPGEHASWSSGLLFQIPNAPHFFSLQASNADVNTMEGTSRRGLFSGGVGKMLYGFEFTIPLHYKRFVAWLKPGTGVPPARKESDAAAEVRMVEFEYRSDTVFVRAGQAVQFLNMDPVEHTVTFDAIATSSGLIPKFGTFVLRFDRAGVWKYHCTPHPFMEGVIVVRER